MKKTWMIGMTSMMCLALFTGCASNADTMPQPSPTVTTAPMATAAPTGTASPAATSAPTAGAADMLPDPANGRVGEGVNTVEDARRVSDQVEEEVEKLSELDSAEAVVAGSIALVGVEYETEYQGGLTDRLRNLVKERVEMVDKAIATVHITDDAEKVKQIAQLNEELEKPGMTFEQLQTKMLEIGSGITGGDSPVPTAGTTASQK